jgi:hypothetical protein
MSIPKEQFKKAVKQFIKNPDIESLESADFLFERQDANNISVKFKNIPGLRGYFSTDELRSNKMISIILKTLERELEKNA